MPRNDQVVRQWHLLRKLEGSRGATLQELVDALPDDYGKNPRTIRRDLEALEAVGFDIESYVRDALMVRRGRRIEVELLFSKTAAAWVKDKIWHQSQDVIPLKDGRLRMVLQVADTNELVGWIMSFGSQVRVIRPDILRRKVKEEARRIIRS